MALLAAAAISRADAATHAGHIKDRRARRGDGDRRQDGVGNGLEAAGSGTDGT